ncbi:MAG: hypothetical protein CMP74_01480 [Flavobacteriales bacterium]|nr:hypothetical protein [Flavobacteriales bacterium]
MEIICSNTQIFRFKMIRIIIFSIFLIFYSTSFSQNKCNNAFKKLNKIEKLIYEDEEKAFNKINKLKIECKEIDIKLYIGNIYFKYKKYSDYVELLRSNWNVNLPDEIIIKYFTSCINTNNYKFAIDVINLYPKNYKFSKQAQNLINNIFFAISEIKENNIIEINKLLISTNKDEYFPSFNSNSDQLIFTRRDDNDENFYLTKNINKSWSKPIILNFPSNTIYNEGAYSISNDSKEIFFASCNRSDGFGNCDIYYAEIINDSLWSDPINLGPSINTKDWESQPSISMDKKLLFFSSNRDGGYGKRDIWCSVRLDKYNWSEPFNLGSNVNTINDEITPFIFYDSKKIFFASNGHVGMGGYDLFFSEIEDGLFKQSKNLGYPINSNKDESCLIISPDSEVGFFSSNRGERDDLDIYEFILPNEMKSDKFISFGGHVIDSISLKPVNNCKILLYNKKLLLKTYTDNDGYFKLKIPANQEISLNILSKNHLFFSKKFNVEEFSILDSKFILKRIKKGEKLVLSNVLFETNEFTLNSQFIEEIKQLAYYLNENKNISIEIAGHTDNVGSESYNLILSEKRAKSVYEKLIEFGVKKNQLSYIGYGFSNPIFPYEDVENRYLNRRTEIIYK